MKINVLTPAIGGPYSWGRDLAYTLKYNRFESNHIADLKLRNIFMRKKYHDCDIIHTTTKHCIFAKKPVILTIKGDYKYESKLFPNDRLYDIAKNRADIITTVSHYLKNRLDLNDAVIIPNAVFPEKYKAVTHADKKTIHIVTVSNFYFEQKIRGVIDNIELLQEACKSTDKNINYHVIGGGKYLNYAREKSKRIALPENMKLHLNGYSSNPIEYLENSDLFLYRSFHDNFPNAILEAMAAGLPIVSNDVGAIKEIIKSKETGYVYEDDDECLMRLSALIDDEKLRANLGVNSQAVVNEQYNWWKIVENYISLYKSL